jgi:hypothetical protein
MNVFSSVVVRRDVKLLTLLVAITVAGWGQPGADQIAPQILVNTGVKWQSPPRSIHATYRYAQVRLVMLYPDGRLTEWGCTLYRDRKSNRISRPYGEGYGVSIGIWNKKSEAVISVSTKLMFADVLKCGDPECRTHVYPEHREDWRLTLSKNGPVRVIDTPRGKLVPITINPSEIPEFEKVAEAYRQK